MSSIETAIANDKWDQAQRLIERALVSEPDSHWLLTRLSLCLYEKRDYRRALTFSKKALKLAPRCPLVLWDYAGALDMLGREREALRIYRSLVRRGIDSIAFGECGEGRAWARGLIADCHYRMSHCYREIGNHRKAVDEMRKHLARRGPGCRSIYDLREVRREFRQF